MKLDGKVQEKQQLERVNFTLQEAKNTREE